MIAVSSAYAQLLGLGVLWVSFHCAGMCGPLLIGLDLAGAARGFSPWRGALQVLSYQAGRALTYAWLGGACGLLGARLNGCFTQAAGLLAMAGGLLVILGMLRRRVLKVPPVKLRRTPRSMPALLVEESRRMLARLASQRSPLSGLALGAVMGFLPCMFMLWALGLAALTASPLHGALVMLLLVAMTTPVLLSVTLLPQLTLGRRRSVPLLAAYLPALSGLWLFLCGGAAIGLWPHSHVGVSLLGQHFMIMLF